MPGAMLGIKCKVYYNSATYATPTWVELTAVGDLTVNPSWDEGDASTRASRIKLSAKTQLSLEVTGTIQASIDDTGYILINEALYTDTALDMMILTGDKTTTGVTGFRCDWMVTAGSQDQSRGAVLYDSITLKPSISANVPKRVEVVAGAPVFTSI